MFYMRTEFIWTVFCHFHKIIFIDLKSKLISYQFNFSFMQITWRGLQVKVVDIEKFVKLNDLSNTYSLFN